MIDVRVLTTEEEERHQEKKSQLVEIYLFLTLHSFEKKYHKYCII